VVHYLRSCVEGRLQPDAWLLEQDHVQLSAVPVQVQQCGAEPDHRVRDTVLRAEQRGQRLRALCAGSLNHEQDDAQPGASVRLFWNELPPAASRARTAL